MLEQVPRVARVLRRDETRLMQNANRARRHILKVTDGCGDEIERAHAMIVSFRECYNIRKEEQR